MTKGQKIIVSLLVVVAVGLVLNLSRGVPGQDILPPRGLPHDHGQDVWNEEAFALDEIRQAIKDANWAASRDVERMIQANEAAQRARRLDFNRSFEPRSAGIPGAAQYWPPPPSPSRSSGGATRSQSDADWLSLQMGAIHVEISTIRELIDELHLQMLDLRAEVQGYDWKSARRFNVQLKNQEAILAALGAKSPFTPSGPGVVGTRPGHPDTIVQDEAVRIEGLRKFFDKLRAAETQEEAQDD